MTQLDKINERNNKTAYIEESVLHRMSDGKLLDVGRKQFATPEHEIWGNVFYASPLMFRTLRRIANDAESAMNAMLEAGASKDDPGYLLVKAFADTSRLCESAALDGVDVAFMNLQAEEYEKRKG